ncbi:MAG TPA: PKD domain-containing protein [Vicinamibacterales bacterium]|jgi:PKD repeat protein
MKTTFLRLIAVAAAAFAAGCVHQTEEPALTGPSTFAQSLRLTATPDSITQDGRSQSSVTVTVFGPNGAPTSGVALRLDMAVGGQLADFGTLSARTVVTANDGTARAVYTAPPPGPDSVISAVSIVATPVGTDAQASNLSTVSIRLVPSGVILPPGGTPTATFSYSPTSVGVNVPVQFDGRASTPGNNATQITNYQWSFGDGGSGTGATPSHTYLTDGTFAVTLTVTNDRGVTATSAAQQVIVTSTDPFTGDWFFSPSTPAVGQPVFFNADQVQSSAGHQVTQFNWNFGDGSTGTGLTPSHTYANAGTYNVVLSVLDDIGRKKVFAAKPVTIGGAAGGSAPVANFTFTPASPVTAPIAVSFDGSSSTSSGGSIVSYVWNFGDGSSAVSTPTPTTSHIYVTPSPAAGYTVSLTVIDNSGHASATPKTSVIVVQ